MHKRRLGSSPLEVSVMGLGCWSFGGGTYWGAQDQRDVDAVVHRATKLGVTFFDTAEAYNDGASERSLGVALQDLREQVLIGTKVNPSNCAPATLRAHCEASLARLQVDYVDLYIVHWPLNRLAIKHFLKPGEPISPLPSVEDTFRTLGDLQDDGKTRAIGISNFGIQQMEEVLATGAKVAANELAFSLLSRAIEVEILPFCQQHGIGVIVDIALQQGLLTGKYASAADVPPMLARSRHFHHSRGQGQSRHGEAGVETEIFNALHLIRKIADREGIPMGQLALAWVMNHPGVSCTLAGSRTVAQLEDNLQATALSISPSIITELDDATSQVLELLGPNPDYYEPRDHSRIR